MRRKDKIKRNKLEVTEKSRPKNLPISKYANQTYHTPCVNAEGVEEAGVEGGGGPGELESRGPGRVVHLAPHSSVLPYHAFN